MKFDAKVLADSVGPNRVRLTTLELTFPRFLLAEFNTHRMLSRSSASSRAIPTAKILERVEQHPFVPLWWGKNQRGMQAEAEIDCPDKAYHVWMVARDQAVGLAKVLLAAGVHKQTVNRLLEPFMWHTVIVTATHWANFFALRCHAAAQPEFRTIALMARQAMAASEPVRVDEDGLHAPLLPDLELLIAEKYNKAEIARISAARCARVSYLTHDGERDPRLDLDLAYRLAKDGHMSPFEHVAFATRSEDRWGNFRGWRQLRKMIPNEDVFEPPGDDE